MEQKQYTLPGGYTDKSGVTHRQVELSPLTGREEAFVATHKRKSPAQLMTMVLSRCVQFPEMAGPISAEMARHLLVGDRLYLLLRLREITFGDQIQATIRCSRSACGHKMDIDFLTTDIPVKEAENDAFWQQMLLSEEAALVTEAGERVTDVLFRLPNGGDQEALASVVAADVHQASLLLLARCIHRLGTIEQPTAAQISQLSPLARREIEQEMERVAPQVELTIEGDCLACGTPFAIPFHLPAFFLNELGTNLDLLYREVHYLAYHYHWSEQEIMAMPRDLRRKYIEILAQEIEKMNHAVR